MRRAFLSLMSVVVLAGFAAAAPAADDEVKAIITKAIKAQGGEELLTKFKAIQSKSKGTLKIMGVEVEFTQEVSAMQPDKLKDVMELSKDGNKVLTRTLISNGDKLVVQANGKDVELNDDMLKAIKELFKESNYAGKVARLVPLLKEKGFELSLIGEDKVEGKPAVGVLVKSKGKKDVSLYFDKKSGLLTKVQRRTVKEGTEMEVNEERIILEYQKKDGLAVPKKILVKQDGEKYLEAEVTEIKLLEKLDDSEFTK